MTDCIQVAWATPDATAAMHDAALTLAQRYGEAAAAQMLRQMADEIETKTPAGFSPESTRRAK